MVKRMRWATILLASFCGLCSGAAAAAVTNLAAAAAITNEPYVRISTSDSNHVRLEIAARCFLPTNGPGPAIWLTAVSHIGDSNYYAALQKELARRTRVLFEGVSAAEDKTSRPERPQHSTRAVSTNASPNSDSSAAGSLQSSLAAALGLVFQLDGMDYDQPNFRNSDLSITELRKLLEENRYRSGEEGGKAGGNGAGESFETLLSLMQGDSWLNSLLQFGLRMVGGSPKLQAFGRLTLIDMLGQIQGDPAQFGALPPDMKKLLDVLLQKRNQKVLADLKKWLRTAGSDDSVAVFYGAGHMPDLQKRLYAEFGYGPSGELWLNAFSVDLKGAGVTSDEREFVRKLVNWQLKQLK